jgi:hypothetical protein
VDCCHPWAATIDLWSTAACFMVIQSW